MTGNWRSPLAFEVLISMLETRMIPEDEWPEVVDHAVKELDEGEPGGGHHPILLADPDRFGFVQACYRRVFRSGGSEFVKMNPRLTIGLLDRLPVDLPMARTLVSLFPKEIPDDCPAESYWEYDVGLFLEDVGALRYYLSNHPEKYNAIVSVARKNGLNYRPFARAMDPSSWSRS